MYRNFVEAVDSTEKKLKDVPAKTMQRDVVEKDVETDVEKEAGLDNVEVTSSTGRSSVPTMLPPLQTSDCKFGWRGISYSVDTKAGKKLILDNVTGCVEKGNKNHSPVLSHFILSSACSLFS